MIIILPAQLPGYAVLDSTNPSADPTDLLVMAFDAVDVDTLKESFSTMPVQPPGGMPRAPIGKRKTSRVEDGVQTSLRLTGAQEDWIEELRETVGAYSKSALVSTVLKTYMGMPKEEK